MRRLDASWYLVKDASFLARYVAAALVVVAVSAAMAGIGSSAILVEWVFASQEKPARHYKVFSVVGLCLCVLALGFPIYLGADYWREAHQPPYDSRSLIGSLLWLWFWLYIPFHYGSMAIMYRRLWQGKRDTKPASKA